MTKNAETAKNTIQTVFDPNYFHTMLGGTLGNRVWKKTEKKTRNSGDMAMRKTTSRLREPHTFSRPDFAKVYAPDLGILFESYLIWATRQHRKYLC